MEKFFLYYLLLVFGIFVIYGSIAHRGLWLDSFFFLGQIAEKKTFLASLEKSFGKYFLLFFEGLLLLPTLVWFKVGVPVSFMTFFVHSFPFLLLIFLTVFLSWYILKPEQKYLIIFPIISLAGIHSIFSFLMVAQGSGFHLLFFWPLVFLSIGNVTRLGKPQRLLLFLLLTVACFYSYRGSVLIMAFLSAMIGFNFFFMAIRKRSLKLRANLQSYILAIIISFTALNYYATTTFGRDMERKKSTVNYIFTNFEVSLPQSAIFFISYTIIFLFLLMFICRARKRAIILIVSLTLLISIIVPTIIEFSSHVLGYNRPFRVIAPFYYMGMGLFYLFFVKVIVPRDPLINLKPRILAMGICALTTFLIWEQRVSTEFYDAYEIVRQDIRENVGMEKSDDKHKNFFKFNYGATFVLPYAYILFQLPYTDRIMYGRSVYYKHDRLVLKSYGRQYFPFKTSSLTKFSTDLLAGSRRRQRPRVENRLVFDKLIK